VTFSLIQIPLSASVIESAELFFTKLFKVNVKACDEARLLLLGKCSLERLPPISDALKQHIKRSHYQTAIWRTDKREIDLPRPEDSGWYLEDQILKPVLRTLEDVPKACLQIVTCICQKLECVSVQKRSLVHSNVYLSERM